MAAASANNSDGDISEGRDDDLEGLAGGDNDQELAEDILAENDPAEEPERPAFEGSTNGAFDTLRLLSKGEARTWGRSEAARMEPYDPSAFEAIDFGQNLEEIEGLTSEFVEAGKEMFRKHMEHTITTQIEQANQPVTEE